MTRSGEGWGGEVASSYRTAFEMQQAERTLLLLEHVAEDAQYRPATLDHLRADLLVLTRTRLRVERLQHRRSAGTVEVRYHRGNEAFHHAEPLALAPAHR